MTDMLKPNEIIIHIKMFDQWTAYIENNQGKTLQIIYDKSLDKLIKKIKSQILQNIKEMQINKINEEPEIKITENDKAIIDILDKK